jgi:DNA mismatch repair protein MutS
MNFHSILFDEPQKHIETQDAPGFFVDLNLDQIIDAITAGKEEYNLKPFFYSPLRDLRAIHYRQAILRDLDQDDLFGHIRAFAQKMRQMRECLALAEKLRHAHQKGRWFLDAVETYCDNLDRLLDALSSFNLQSSGLTLFRDYLGQYTHSVRFTFLRADTKRLKADLATVKYCIEIKGDTFTVRKFAGETDYSALTQAAFEKFQRAPVKTYLAKIHSWPDVDDVEGKILDFIALLFPEIFSRLNANYVQNKAFIDPGIKTFDREVQFYVSYIEHAARIRCAGLSFCYPRVSDQLKEVYDYEGFDLALANKLIQDQSPVICNDFHIKGQERIIVVSGPNQGGKTTFARTFGQLHYLASIGCMVPGRVAQLYLFDNLYTHFEIEEDIKTRRGKLEDELTRIHAILRQVTSRSIVIMNESFTSTMPSDAVFLGKKVLERLLELDVLSVCVTFIDELASLSEKVVSMVSTVSPANPALRTFKIVRKPADGLSYAMSIAEKYGLTYNRLKERTRR